jgi:hypothetical protein
MNLFEGYYEEIKIADTWNSEHYVVCTGDDTCVNIDTSEAAGFLTISYARAHRRFSAAIGLLKKNRSMGLGIIACAAALERAFVDAHMYKLHIISYDTNEIGNKMYQKYLKQEGYSRAMINSGDIHVGQYYYGLTIDEYRDTKEKMVEQFIREGRFEKIFRES